MNIQLHQNARTTPVIRLELQAQLQSVTNQEFSASLQLQPPHGCERTASTAPYNRVVVMRETP